MRELTIDPGPGFAFRPGQWVSVRIPNDEADKLDRAYSIASAPRGDGTFELAVARIEGGPGSNYLHHIEHGTTLRVSDAQGLFGLEPMVRPILMVATGTGITPFRSMLHAAMESGERLPALTVLFGMRTEADLLYRDELERLAERLSGFRYVATLSRGEESWTGLRGYVQEHVPRLVQELGGDVDAYACGLNKMVREVRQVLKATCGLPRQRIHTERYD